MKFLRTLIAAAAVALSAPAAAQLPPINAVAGPTSSAELRRIITDENGTGTLLFGGADGNSLVNLNASALATGTVANARLIGLGSTTVNGQTCTLGSTCTVSASATGVTVAVTTISGGTSNGLLYNNAGVLGNISTANNGVLVTNGSGVPSVSTTLPSGLTITNPSITGGTVNNNIIGFTTSQAAYFQPVFSMLNGFGNQGGGSAWQTQGHANWNVVQSTIPNNPTEWQIYNHASQGVAQITGSNTLLRIRGTAFDAAWDTGSEFSGFYYNGVGYLVTGVTGDTITITTVGGGDPGLVPSATLHSYYYVSTTVTNVCDVNGTTVTYVSGQPFIGFNNYFSINGTPHTISVYNSQTTLTLSAPAGTLTGATCFQRAHIGGGELTTLRTQALQGPDEEGMISYVTPAAGWIRSFQAGAGEYRPIYIGSGELAGGIGQTQIAVYPGTTIGTPGPLSLGGYLGSESLRVLSVQDQVNHFYMGGNTTGGSVYLASRGSDSGVGMNFDVKGAATFNFSRDFTNAEFQIYGNGGASFLSVGSHATSPFLAAQSSGPNADVRVLGKGTGAVILNTSVNVTPLPYEQMLVNEYGIVNWLRDFGRAGGGTAWYNFGHPNWNAVQSTLNYNPTEWQIYPSAGQGKASCQNPGVTGVVIREWGTEFDPAWAGRKGFYLVPDDQLSGIRTVASVTDANTLTMSTTCQGVGQQTFSFVTTSNVGTVNINGTTVTYVSGQPFNVFATEAGSWQFNGVGGYTCTSITMTTATCDTTGTSTGVSYLSDSNIDDELATFNMQKFLGSTEENLSFKAHASGYYSIKPQIAGEGKFRPFFLGSGYYTAASEHNFQLSMYPNRDLSLGGLYNRETIRIPGQTGQYYTNFFLAQPGQFGNPGLETPSISSRPCGSCSPSPAGVGFGIGTFGNGTVDFTSHSFGNFEFRIFGNGGAAYLTIGSDATSPFIAPDGPTNANLALYARGTGSILLNNSTAVSGALNSSGAFYSSSHVASGSGTLTLSTGSYGITKTTAAGSAPGATGGRIELVCGTSPGTGKLQITAGTSNTPVVIQDNIGAGVTGC